MNKTKVSVSKILKLPIPGIAFSNQQVGVTIDYEGKDFDIEKAEKELSSMVNKLRDPDPDWLKEEEKGGKK